MTTYQKLVLKTLAVILLTLSYKAPDSLEKTIRSTLDELLESF